MAHPSDSKRFCGRAVTRAIGEEDLTCRRCARGTTISTQWSQRIRQPKTSAHSASCSAEREELSAPPASQSMALVFAFQQTLSQIFVHILLFHQISFETMLQLCYFLPVLRNEKIHFGFVLFQQSVVGVFAFAE